jgi:hypothetical protein
LAKIEVAPARELFPGVDFSKLPIEEKGDEELDASEPTFDVVLHPKNDAALGERYSWRMRSSSVLAAPIPKSEGPEGTVTSVRQGLSADIAVGISLDPGERWRTSRQYCHAFGFVADVAGIADVCIDLGYDGVAGHMCTLAYDPRDPIVLFHPGPDINPTNRHYFRGRVTGRTLFGVGLPTVILAAGYACL